MQSVTDITMSKVQRKNKKSKIFEEAEYDKSEIKWLTSKKGEFRENHSMTLQLQPRTRSSKCVGACQKRLVKLKNSRERKYPRYNHIPKKVWFLLSLYIQPEDVKTFALICRQSANVLKSHFFWKQLYTRCCLKKNSDPIYLSCFILRRIVIKRLFLHYQPFVERVKCGIQLKTLIGKVFICHFVEKTKHYWITCYKFHTDLPQGDRQAQMALSPPNKSTERTKSPAPTVDNWEDLFVEFTIGSETNDNYTKESHYCKSSLKVDEEEEEGVYLLLIRSKNFSSLTLQRDHDQGMRFRLKSVESHEKDKSVNLELLFSSSIENQMFLMRYENLVNYEVSPWWHPNYRRLYKTYCKSANRIINCNN